MSNIPLRATDGLDAAGKQIVNVGYPNITSPMDGVSVKFFIDENTIQQHDKTRTYKKNFAVIYNNRIFVSTVDIKTPEDFVQSKWKPVRNDPSWRVVTTNAPASTSIGAGEHIIVQTSSQDINFTLPATALSGDMVVIRENGSNLHDYIIEVNGNGRTISGMGSVNITAPYSATYFILNGNEWIIQTEYKGDVNKKIISSSSYLVGSYYKAMVGDQLMRETQYSGGILIKLPRLANHGDTITTYDLDGMNPVTKTTISVHDSSTHTIITEPGISGARSVVFDSTDWGVLVYDKQANAWRVYDGDSKSRWKSVKTATYSAVPNDKLVVYTKTASEVKVTFPKDAAQGDSFFVDTRYMAKGSKLTLQIESTSVNDYFIPDSQTLTNPRISAYRKMLGNLETTKTKTHSFMIDNRGEQFEFVYFKKALGLENDIWALVTLNEIPYRVDRNVTDFYGMAAIATQASVNKNKEDIVTGQNPDCEDFVTPETLSNKIANGVNRGILRISTLAEAKATSGNLATEGWSGVAITPYLLNDRLATTGMRGLARIATQAEANALTGSGEAWGQKIITPQTLNGRISTEAQTGLISVVAAGGTKQPTRTTVGTGVHNFTDHSKAVTPKTLFEKVATEVSQGMVFIGNQTEVNAGTVDTANGALVVTAATLHGRQATSSLTGLSRAATAAEAVSMTPPAGDNVHVSIKGLVSRTASEARTGLGETSTQAEVDAGTLHDRFFVSPKTFGNWLTRERLTVVSADGLTSTGNIWKGQQFGAVVPTEIQRGTSRVATQLESNDMTATALDDVILTPKKLSARQATTTMTGIISIATQAEVDAGTNNTKVVTPLTNLTSVRNSANYRMTDTRYGVGKTAILTNGNGATSVFEGNDTVGSTRDVAGYAHGDIVVSPRGLNTALVNYLPKMATAQNSLKLGGVVAADWVRRTVNQVITGGMEFSKSITVKVPLQSRVDIIDSGLNSHSTIVKMTNTTNDLGWDFGVYELNGPFTIRERKSTSLFPSVLSIYTDYSQFSGRVLNGGQNPSSSNDLVRYAFSESRYVRSSGNITENITGLKTFVNNTYFKNTANQYIYMGKTSKSGIVIDTSEKLDISSLGGMTISPNGISSNTNQTKFETNGDVKFAGQVKISTAIPVAPEDAVRKDYLDNALDDVNTTSGTRVFKGGDTMTGELVVNSTKAITANGEVNLNGTTTVNKLRIAVGNGEFLEIRANPTTKSVDFVWIS